MRRLSSRRVCLVLTVCATTLTTLPAAAKNPTALVLPKLDGPLVGQIHSLVPSGNGVLVEGNDGTPDTILFASDGTVAGTTAFAAVPKVDASVGDVSFLGAVGGEAFFQDRSMVLWKTGGTFATTTSVAPGFGTPYSVRALANGLLTYMIPTPGDAFTSELVRTDGTAQGTSKIAGASVQTASTTFADGSDLVFAARGGGVKKTDGTTVTDVVASPSTTDSIARCGGILYVGSGGSLLRVDGPTATTLRTGESRVFACAGTKLVFRGCTSSTNCEPWVSDGTVGGTKILVDTSPGTFSGLDTSYAPTVVGSRVFFRATDGATGDEPWITDGTTAGTKRIGDLATGTSGSAAYPLGVVGSSLYFMATDASNVPALYAIDDGSTTARVVTTSLLTEPSTRSATAGGKIFAISKNMYLWVFDPSQPVDIGDGQPESVPHAAPPTLAAPTTPGTSSSSSSGTSSSSGGGSPSSSSGGASSSGEGATSSGGSSGDGAQTASGDGGGCSAAPGRSSASWIAAGVGTALLVLARRRRRAR